MSRLVRVSAAQMGPIERHATRVSSVQRILDLMRRARDAGSEMVVFPELCLTTFFARFVFEGEQEIDSYCETGMPGSDTQPIFDEARRLRLCFCLGYAELDFSSGQKRRFNTSMLVDQSGHIVGKYRKVHVPGFAEPQPNLPSANLEKRYFVPGDLGFPVWRFLGGYAGMCLCNDRRWPETYRVMGLQGVEMIVLGFNTPDSNIFHSEPVHRRMFHHMLSLQAGAYQNGTWVVAAAKSGKEDGHGLIGGSAIVAPTGEVAAQAVSEGDEIISYACDLDLGRNIKEVVFNFAKHRRIEHYKLITEQTGVVLPPE